MELFLPKLLILEEANGLHWENIVSNGKKLKTIVYILHIVHYIT